MNKKISNYIKILVLSLAPIFIGPVLIHFGSIKETYLLSVLGVIICLTAIVMIFISLFGIINELFKK